MAPSLEDGIGVAVNIFMIARRFEDLEAWQLANEVKQRVYALLDMRVSGISCVGHSMRSVYAPQTEVVDP